jgi:hypothetical protein
MLNAIANHSHLQLLWPDTRRCAAGFCTGVGLRPRMRRSFPWYAGRVTNGGPDGYWQVAMRVFARVALSAATNDQSFLTHSPKACHGCRFQWPRACPDGEGKTNSCVPAMVLSCKP